MRRPAVTLLLVAACAETGLAPVEERLAVEPARVDFGRTFVGHPRARTVTIRSDFRDPRRFRVAVDPPFAVEVSELEVAGASTGSLVVRFAPTVTGDVTRTLRLSSGAESFVVEILGRGEEVPDCASTATCQVSRFEPDRGECVTGPAGDQTPCANGCLDAGHCEAGACVGTQRSCDDHNRCTVDACDPATGCVHQHAPVVVCPASSDPCRVPTCDPVRGCATVPAADGTRCGTYDCTAAHLCAQGRCVALDVPEGAPCRLESQSLCPGETVCRAKKCIDVGPNELQPIWEYALPERGDPGQLAMDGEGNTYFVEIEPAGKTWLSSLDRSGRLRFKVDLGTDRCWGYVFPVVSGDAVLIPSGDGVLKARSLVDGSELWRTDIGAAIEDRGLAKAAGRVGIRYITGLHRGYVIVNTTGNCATRGLENALWFAVVATRDGAVVDVRRQRAQLRSWPVTNSAGDMFVVEGDNHGRSDSLRRYDPQGLVRWDVASDVLTGAPAYCAWPASSDDAVFCWEYGKPDGGWLIGSETGSPIHRLPIAKHYWDGEPGGDVPVLTQGRLIVGGVACRSWICPWEHASIIWAFETLTGTPLWQRDLAAPDESARLSSPVALRDSVLWLKWESNGHRDRSELYELSFDGELRSRCSLPPHGQSHLLLAHGLLVNRVGPWDSGASSLRGYLINREASTSGSTQYRGGPGQTGQSLPENAP